MTQGTLTLTIPPGWTLPSTTKGAAGYVTLTPSTAGTLAITGTTTIEVTGVTLDAGKGFSITYGTGGGATGVRVTSTLGTSALVREASTASGTPATVAHQPNVHVVATCTSTTGTRTLATGATTHFSLRGASSGSGGNTGGVSAGGTVISGTLTNTSGATVTLTYTFGCEGFPGGVQTGGPGGAGYAAGGKGGTGHSAEAGGGGGGGGASALTFTINATTTVVAVAGGGGDGGDDGTFSNLSVATGTNGATATVSFT